MNVVLSSNFVTLNFAHYWIKKVYNIDTCFMSLLFKLTLEILFCKTDTVFERFLNTSLEFSTHNYR